MNTHSFRFGVNVSCWDYRNLPSTTGLFRSEPTLSGSWPGSMPGTWRILLQGADAWSTTWPPTGSRRGATGCDTSCFAWGYEPSTRNQGRPFLVMQRNDSRALWTLRSGQWHRMRPEQTDITYIPLRKGFLYLVAIIDFYTWHLYSFGEACGYSWKLSNSLDKEFWLGAQEKALGSERKTRNLPHGSWAVNSHRTDFLSTACRQRTRSRSAGRAGSVALTTSWWNGMWRTVK